MATFWSFADNAAMTAIWLVYRSMDFFRSRRLFNRPVHEMCWRVSKTWYAELFSPWVQLGEGVEDTRRRAKLSEIVAKHPKT
jgi:hypothetical protein